ncbi:Dienelactone hydrolase family protein [Opitutaceae bacterium TAV1]|nr:Dienelactone hydrolase family protein [Opitutaceae bacterium TAV1]
MRIPLYSAFLGLLLSLTLFAANANTGTIASASPFARHLDGSVPHILKTIEPGELSNSVYPPPADATIDYFVIESRIEDNTTNGIFCLLARPADGSPAYQTKPYPAILLLHGGGSSGLQQRTAALAWATRGYVVLAPDLPGIANAKSTPHSAGGWTRLPYGERRWTVSPSITSSTIYQTIAAALDAFALLRTRSDVDAARIGITGISWGGYTTTMLCGLLGPQVRAGFSNYGCGFYEDTTFNRALSHLTVANRATWLAQLDAGRRAPGIAAPFFIAGATNDAYFYPPAVERTLAAIPGQAVSRVYAPNADHQLPIPGGVTQTGGAAAMAEQWFAWHLQGRGAEFPVITLEPVAADAVATKVRFCIKSPRPIKTVFLVSSLPPKEGGWPKRKWEKQAVLPVPPVNGATRYEATLSGDIATHPGAAWFILASDNRPVSVSSPIIIHPE